MYKSSGILKRAKKGKLDSDGSEWNYKDDNDDFGLANIYNILL